MHTTGPNAKFARHVTARAARLLVSGALGIGGLFLTGMTLAAPASADTVVQGCIIVSSPTSTHHTRCPGANLAGADLTPYDLSYADLVGANLSSTTLAHCAILFPPLSIPCSATNFTNARLTGAHISGTPSSCVTLQTTPTLTAVRCIGANLNGATLAHASLGDDFSSVTFHGSGLNSVNLSSATLVTCYQIAAGGIDECPGADFSNAVMHRVDLAGRDLTTTTFAGADLTGSDLAASSFGLVEPDNIGTFPTDFHGAKLTHVDLSGTNIGLADLSASDLDRAILTDTALIPSDQTVSATSAKGAVVTWPTPPSQPGATPGGCSRPSGSRFPIGVTTVKCFVSDSSGNDAKGYLTVTVT
jgi:uncharacterized protein YjbI with pentapeptide repeats